MDHQQHGENNNSIQELGNDDELATISLRSSSSSSLENYERIQLHPIRSLRVIPRDVSLDVTSNLGAQESNQDEDVDTLGDEIDPFGFQMNGNYRSIRLSTSDREPWHRRSSSVVVRVNPYSTTSLLESK